MVSSAGDGSCAIHRSDYWSSRTCHPGKFEFVTKRDPRVGFECFFEYRSQLAVRPIGSAPMKRLSSALILLGVVVLLAAGAACLSISLYSKWHKPAYQNAHDWIHTQLNLSAEQDLALEPIEKRYRSERQNLEQQLTLANRELAEAILADGRDSERVHSAIEKIHLHMGALQRVTIGHVFEMKEILTPEQYRKLLNLTANALYNLDSGHAAE